jgi:hypothetical protein
MDVSVVVIGRNDNYKSSIVPYLSRLNLFSHTLNKFMEGLDWELILVDYNPPPNKKLLSQALDWSDIPVKHRVVKRNERSEFIAKHVKAGARLLNAAGKRVSWELFPVYLLHGAREGLKCATGDWVLWTSTDNVFGGSLNDVVGKLELNCFYRAFRLNFGIKDLSSFDLLCESPENTLATLRKRIIGRRSSGWRKKVRRNIWKAAGDFMLLPREVCLKFGGYVPMAHPKPKDAYTQFVFAALLNGCKIKKLNYRFINMHFSDTTHMKHVMTSYNYVCKKYNFLSWKKTKEFLCFKEWAHDIATSPKGWTGYDFLWIKRLFDNILRE